MKPLEAARGPVVRTKAALDRAMQRAPIRSLRGLVGKGPIIVLAPHPDDECFGCGGLLAAAAAAGLPVYVRFLTDGRHSHPGSTSWPPNRVAAQRRFEAQRAACALKLRPSALRFESQHDGTLIMDWRRAEAIAKRIAAEVRRWPQPTLIAPWRGDAHPDHMAAATIADMVERACPRARGLRYLIWTRVQPRDHAVRVDPRRIWRFPIQDWRHRKRGALNSYRSQTTRLIEDVDNHPVAPELDLFLGYYEPYLASDA